MYLIGSKADLAEDRQVEKQDAADFCAENNISKHFETSSMTGLNVEEVFAMAAKDLYVREAMKAADEPEQAQEETPAKSASGSRSSSKNRKQNSSSRVELGKKSLTEKKKDKGCC